MGILAKIRRMYFREKVPLREIARRTGLSRNTVRTWLRQADATEPKYPKRTSPSVIDDWSPQLANWLKADSHRPKRDRRTARFLFEAIREQGYAGSYGRVSASCGVGTRSRSKPPARRRTCRSRSSGEKHSNSTGVVSTPSLVACAAVWKSRTPAHLPRSVACLAAAFTTT